MYFSRLNEIIAKSIGASPKAQVEEMNIVPKRLKPFFSIFRPYYKPLMLEAISFLSFVFNAYDAEIATRRIYPRFVHRNDIVIEVGVMFGADTKFLANIAKSVYAFEASKANFRRARMLLRKRKNVFLYNVAISNKKGETLLFKKPRQPSSDTILREFAQGFDTELVKTLPLDRMKFNETPTVLICDAEGSEIDVLEGTKRSMASIKTVLIECHRSENGQGTSEQVSRRLKSYGFDVKTTIIPTNPGASEIWVFGVKPS